MGDLVFSRRKIFELLGLTIPCALIVTRLGTHWTNSSREQIPGVDDILVEGGAALNGCKIVMRPNGRIILKPSSTMTYCNIQWEPEE